ncbi:hypothetical protein [Paraconexibacter algicola]|uniref:Delta-60 repeat domain-containing protein n=1 Tax=Paraconexibacter algicola TaxID=2133960 RepID=A0A2T4UEW9_9ACTN|nr:hypothetical protein [Paraconexibacter algicola]PTL56285.1 hypothetical protein C7Y72_15015 [Paraconexibacter algicola]
MSRPLRAPSAAAPALLSLLALLAGSPAGAHAADDTSALTAPGRTVLTGTAVAAGPNAETGGATAAVALPDGGAVLAGTDPGRGLLLARIGLTGAPDPTFGPGGVRRLAVPGGPLVGQLLRRQDGRLLALAIDPAAGSLRLRGLTADGRPDPAFGTDGVADPGLRVDCGGCGAATLLPDGSTVVGGVAGGVGAVVRLDPDGRPDPGFGATGRAAVAEAAGGGEAGVVAVAATATGRIVVLARGTDGRLLVRALTAAGLPDPGFADGGARRLDDGPDGSLLVREDGSVDVLGAATLTRLTPDGRPDPAFGGTGTVPIPGGGALAPRPRMLAGAAGTTLVARPAALEPRLATDPGLTVRRVGRDGTVDPVAAPPLGFGGGYASPGRSGRLLLGGVAQDGFVASTLVRRPDGGVLAVGGTRVIRFVTRGRGASRAWFAVAGLTPALQPDPAFGGPPRPTVVRVRVPAQRATGGAQTRRIRVRVRATAPGLLLLRVRDRAGRVLGQTVAPLYRAGTVTVRVPVGAQGRRLLARGRRTPIVVGHELRDVVGTTGAGSAPATLR